MKGLSVSAPLARRIVIIILLAVSIDRETIQTNKLNARVDIIQTMVSEEFILYWHELL